MMTIRSIAAAVAALTMTTAIPAIAHADLVSSTPAAQSTVTSARQITLRFSERVMPRLTGIAVTHAHMSHADHATMAGMAPMPAIRARLSHDGMTMTGTFARALPPGEYTVTWHAVADDTHREEGHFNFTVR
ncbi:MAG: copper homeostasis periplasmic binding protein CopC [Alteraurantiacibacter sp.]